MTVISAHPAASEYAPHQAIYVKAVPDGDITTLLRENAKALDASFASVPSDRAGYRYAVGKWTIKEVAGHLIDGERILSYRALRAARGDSTVLPGYDGDAYVDTSESNQRTLSDLGDELRAVRESTVRLFVSLPANAWTRVGTVDGHVVSVRAFAHIIVGHAIHHLQVLAERYGI